MKRRDFLAAGLGGTVLVAGTPSPNRRWEPAQDTVRSLFPRLARETYVDAAAGIPLGAFAEAGLRRYADFQRLGPDGGRGAYVARVLRDLRGSFAALIGARPSEIALVHCTKAGEQTVLEGLDPGRHGRNIVTNDMHFSGSLHHLVGLLRAGVDVRIVRGREWDVSLEDMAAAIDDDTALVAITLVSNVTGRIEPIRDLADIAHAHGALVYADIIQAAGVMPVDVRAMGIDFAAANGYKWLYGVHGAAFLFVREELQGTALPDRLYPGHVVYNYPPWVDRADPAREPLVYEPPTDASRYQPGHVSYLGYCAVSEGIEFIRRHGTAATLAHSVALNGRLIDGVDAERYELLSPHVERSPIVTYRRRDGRRVEEALGAAGVTVSVLGPERNLVRVSPALYNDERDIDRVVEVLNAV